VILLRSRQINVLKLSLLGTILSSLLLTAGLSFFLGGVTRAHQDFNADIARKISTLLLLAVSSLIIPSVFNSMVLEQMWVPEEHGTPVKGLLPQSRGIALLLLFCYSVWLLFTHNTHRWLYNAPSSKSTKKQSGGNIPRKLLQGNAASEAEPVHDEDEGDVCEEYHMSLPGAIVTLVVSVVLLAFNTQFASDSIQALLQRRKVTQTFLSLIILPLLSIDPMAINMAMQDKMDVSVSLALERCMQTSLMVIPLIVLLAWCMGINEMDLVFSQFLIASFFASILVVTYVVQKGRTNW
jgi:Ca2+:H+ antiporter